MNITFERTKPLLLSAAIGAAITYGFLTWMADKESGQNQDVVALENKVQQLEELLAQKNAELTRASSLNMSNSGKPKQTVEAQAAQQESGKQSDDVNQALGMSNPTPSEQIQRDLITQSDRDPRSFSVKVNDLLAANSSAENIAIVSKSVFDLAESRETLSDSELDVLYHGQNNPDIKRVVAQVASARGDNILMEKQVAEAQAGLRSESPSVRQKTLIELAKTRHVSAANAITPLLQDSDSSVKLDALLALRATGNQSHIGVVEQLVNDPDPAVSWLANDVISNLQNLSDKARTKLSSIDIMAELPLMPAPNS
ncbi:MAG: HEAT repeat domain-containing protein [Cellvibrio sp.]|uniref:HEAT repeat domain-containing protein n=1 Tax=Cellvibrio sp. TaxID=1965322 RepID=UPI0031AFF926